MQGERVPGPDEGAGAGGAGGSPPPRLGELFEVVSALTGETATRAIFRSALRNAGRHHPILIRFKVVAGGVLPVESEGLEDDLLGAEARAALAAVVDQVVELFADLTGDILRPRVQPVADACKSSLLAGVTS